MALYPQVVDRVVDEPRFEVRRLIHKPASRNNLIDQETGMIGGQFESLLFRDAADDPIENRVGQLQSKALALVLEDPPVDLQAGGSEVSSCRLTCWVNSSSVTGAGPA